MENMADGSGPVDFGQSRVRLFDESTASSSDPQADKPSPDDATCVIALDSPGAVIPVVAETMQAKSNPPPATPSQASAAVLPVTRSLQEYFAFRVRFCVLNRML